MKIQNGFSLKPLTPEAKVAQQDAALKDAAKLYENHFLNEMVKAMRSTVGQEDGVIKKNYAEKLFTEQLDQQYAQNWAEKGGVGLADMIYTQIKEKYIGSQGKNGKQIQDIQHMLPITPKKDLHGIGSPDSIQMKAIPQTPGSPKLGFRFDVPNPSQGGFEVQAPMAGKVTRMERLPGLGQDDLSVWQSVELDHGDGLSSELTFPGQVTDLGVGSELNAGQRLGMLDSMHPSLAWNLDWSLG